MTIEFPKYLIISLLKQPWGSCMNVIELLLRNSSQHTEIKTKIPEFSGWLVGVLVGLLAADKLTGSSSSPSEKN